MEVGRSMTGNVHGGVLLFGLLDAAFDVADRFQVLGQLAAVGCAQPAFQPVNIPRHIIQNAALLIQAGQAGGRVGAVAVAKQPLEDRARADLHGVGSGGAAPGDGIGVGATITGIAIAGQRGRFEADLERSQLGGLAELAGGDLVDGNAGVDVSALGFLGMHTRQPGGAGTRVVSGSVAEGPAVRLRQSAQHQHVVAEGLQRLHGGSKFESRPFARGSPAVHDDPVGHVDKAQAHGRISRRVLGQRERGYHRVEQRQSHRGPEAAQKRATR